MFDDISNRTKLQKAVSAVVDYRKKTSMIERGSVLFSSRSVGLRNHVGGL